MVSNRCAQPNFHQRKIHALQHHLEMDTTSDRFTFTQAVVNVVVPYDDQRVPPPVTRSQGLGVERPKQPKQWSLCVDFEYMASSRLKHYEFE